jgi:hypothetical protein
MLPPVASEPVRERVRTLFDRIDEGEAAERLAAFSLDVPAVKDALSLLATHWLDEALSSFGKGLKPDEPAYQELSQYILQLHIVGFQAGYCADRSTTASPPTESGASRRPKDLPGPARSSPSQQKDVPWAACSPATSTSSTPAARSRVAAVAVDGNDRLRRRGRSAGFAAD